MVKQDGEHKDDDPAGDGQSAYAAHHTVCFSELGSPYLFEKAGKIAEVYQQGVDQQYDHQQVLCSQYVSIEVILIQGQKDSADNKRDKRDPGDKRNTTCNTRPFKSLLIRL